MSISFMCVAGGGMLMCSFAVFVFYVGGGRKHQNHGGHAGGAVFYLLENK